MKLVYRFLIALLIFPALTFGQNNKVYTEQEARELIKTIEGSPFKLTENTQAQWFPKAGLGLFIHWGIHSVAALDPSWTMIKNCPWAGPGYAINHNDYYRLANEFNPSSYDPEKWILAAKEAGFQYVVLTTKHHDGYCLWPSKFGDWNTGKYMDGRDLLKPYVAACRKYGLKVGFYFSPRDWSNPVYPIPYPDYDYKNSFSETKYPKETNQQKFDEFFDTTIGQLSELLTNYGKIDILWFDGVDWPEVDTHPEKLHAWLRTLQPEMIINPRWNTNDETKPFGDFKTEEIDWGNHPEHKPENIEDGEWWEFCNTWSGNWGYSPTKPFTNISGIIKILVYTRSYGGNYLLNIGPAPDGTMRPGFYTECINLSAWMKYNKESVIGTTPCLQADLCNVPVTTKENIWYLHLLPEIDGKIEIESKKKPKQVIHLQTNKNIDYVQSGKKLIINFPENDRSNIDDVIKINW